MSEAEIGGRARGAIRDENGNGDALGATDWICLAATPTFAIMALLTAVPDGGSPDMLCSAAAGSPLGGMVPMYLLMSAFALAEADLEPTTRRSPVLIGRSNWTASQHSTEGDDT